MKIIEQGRLASEREPKRFYTLTPDCRLTLLPGVYTMDEAARVFIALLARHLDGKRMRVEVWTAEQAKRDAQ